MIGKPGAELEVDARIVRGLLREQHPDLAELPVVEFASGWDNVMFRLGDSLVVRVPRTSASAELIAHEQRWLPVLASSLPLSVPVPLRLGTRSEALGVPWPWSICPWLPGEAFEHTRPLSAADAAESLARFVTALHRPAPSDAPVNPWRGVPLAAREERLHANLDGLRDVVDRNQVLSRWSALVRAPEWTGPPMWLHGDLHPLNLLVDQGRLSAVIDFGDICAGDPASDLGTAWMLFGPHVRAAFRRAIGADDATWRRAQGWALALGLAFACGDERIAGIGRRTLAAVLADEP